jgi:MFS family permease
MRSSWSAPPMNLVVDYARQFQRFRRNARLYLINNALSGVTTGILLVLYNLYLVSLGYGTAFVGVVLFVGTIGGGIAIFPAGFCVDRLRSKTILIFSNLLIAVAGAGQILFRQPAPLLVSSFLVGVGLAFILVINAPFLTRNSDPEERSHLFSMNISLGLITLVLGEFLGGVLPLWFRSMSWLMVPLPPWASTILASQPNPRSYQLALLFAGLLAAPSLIPLFMLREDAAPLTRRGGGGVEGWGRLRRPRNLFRMHESVAQQITRATQASPPRVIPAPTDDSHKSANLRIGWRNTLLALVHTPFFFLTLVYVLTGLGAGLVVPYFNLFFVQHLRASPALFGLIDGGANGLTALTTLVAPWLAQRMGKIPSIALTRLLSIPVLLLIGLPGLLPLAALLYPFRQGVMDMSNGVLLVFAMESVEERYRGIANSTYQAAFQVPWALTASIGGFLIARLGYTPLFLLTAACYLLAIAVLVGRFRRSELVVHMREGADRGGGDTAGQHERDDGEHETGDREALALDASHADGGEHQAND